MSQNTDSLSKGTYVVANGAISMFGCSDLEIVGGGTDLEKAIEQFNTTEPEGTVIDYRGTVAKKHTYLLVILKAKTADLPRPTQNETSKEG
ncbi:MAG: hypothetical protein PHC68_17620 [Syntrophorhabdaceae bacterium]|nr:hypothetical protein [Syntrophorhabdaceae bacterium]